MGDIEKELAAIPVERAGASLDGRMERLFRQPALPLPWYRKPVPVWAVALVAMVALVGGLAWRGDETPAHSEGEETVRTVYVVPVPPEVLQALQAGTTSRSASPNRRVVLEVAPMRSDEWKLKGGTI